MDRTSYAYHYYYYCCLMRRRRLMAIFSCILHLYLRTRRKRRTVWVQPYISRRERLGCHKTLFLELRRENTDKFRRCMRMTVEMFDWLVEKVSPHIHKQDTNMRKSISVSERMSITLRHLATGETQESLALKYRVGQSTVSGIVKETCKAIYDVLNETYLRHPSNEEEWRVVASDYETRWNFPHCIGAIDGKHVRIDPPLKSGSIYHNYQGFFSIVLMAVVDAQLRFTYVDVGSNGRASDRGIWARCSLKEALDNNLLGVPPPSALPGTEYSFPFTLVGDEGFTLSTKLMMPYPKEQLRFRDDRRIFNYRLSRARRCSENAFGVMANRFQIFRSAMRYDPDDARTIILAILCLHNLLRTDTVGTLMYSQPELLDREDVLTGRIHRGEHRNMAPQGLLPLGNQGGNRHADDALTIRERWTYYFNGPGAVSWQDRMIHPQVQ